MKTPSMFPRILPIGMLMVAASCTNNAPPAEVCTLIGCDDGLAVEIAGDRDGPVQIRVEAPDQETRTFECSDASVRCGTFLGGFTPSEVTVVVIDAGGQETARTLTPTYETTYPNGPDCPPGCEQATVRMSV